MRNSRLKKTQGETIWSHLFAQKVCLGKPFEACQ